MLKTKKKSDLIEKKSSRLNLTRLRYRE